MVLEYPNRLHILDVSIINSSAPRDPSEMGLSVKGNTKMWQGAITPDIGLGNTSIAAVKCGARNSV